MGWLFAIVCVLCTTAIIITAMITANPNAKPPKPNSYREFLDQYGSNDIAIVTQSDQDKDNL